MNYWWLALAGLANYLFIGLKAFQQRNVIHNNHAMVVVTSNLIAVVEVFVVYTIASKGFSWQLVVTLGMAGGLGCLTAMRLHDFIMGARRASTAVKTEG